MTISFFDTKVYDRDSFAEANLPIRFFETRLDRDTAALARGCDAVCVFVNDVLDESCLRALAEQGVRHVALRCAGYNNVDVAVAQELGIAVTRVPCYSPYAVAEHTVALLLTLNRQTHRAYNRVREHNFSLSGLVGFDVHSKVVGIVGAGQIGRITAQIFRGFGCRVMVSDPELDKGWADQWQIEAVQLSDVLAQSDIISLHLPLTPSTHHLIDSGALAKMKEGAYLINTSRGGLIETTALISALKQGQLGGVALDVYEEEGGVFFEDLSETILQDDDLSRLLTFPNVLVTSHQGFLTEEALEEIARVTISNLSAGRQKKPYLDGTQIC